MLPTHDPFELTAADFIGTPVDEVMRESAAMVRAGLDAMRAAALKGGYSPDALRLVDMARWNVGMAMQAAKLEDRPRVDE